MSKLNAKQKAFICEYVKDWNATQAAIRSGYSKHSAKVQGSRLLTNADITAEINKRTEKIEKKAEVSAEYVVSSLKELSLRCMQKVPVMYFDKESRQLMQETDPKTGEGIWEFDSSGANKSLELLGKYLNIFSEKIQLSGGVTVNLVEAIHAARIARGLEE